MTPVPPWLFPPLSFLVYLAFSFFSLFFHFGSFCFSFLFTFYLLVNVIIIIIVRIIIIIYHISSTGFSPLMMMMMMMIVHLFPQSSAFFFSCWRVVQLVLYYALLYLCCGVPYSTLFTVLFDPDIYCAVLYVHRLQYCGVHCFTVLHCTLYCAKRERKIRERKERGQGKGKGKEKTLSCFRTFGRDGES